MFEKVKKRVQSLTIFEIFISISIIVFTVFIVKFFGQKVESKIIRIEVINKSWGESWNPYGYRTPFWLSDKLKIGQKEYDKSGNVIAEIIDIENYARGNEEAEIYLTVRVRTEYQKRLRQHFFKNIPLDLGSSIEIAPDQNIVYGQVIDNNVPPQGYLKKEFSIIARGRGYDQYVIDNIKIGERVENRHNGEAVATIVELHTEKTTQMYVSEITNYNDQGLSFRVDPNTQDIVVKLNMTAEQIDKRWYFAGHQQLKISNSIWFYGQNVDLILEIESIEEL